MCCSSIWEEAHSLFFRCHIHFQAPQNCFVICNRRQGMKWVLLLNLLCFLCIIFLISFWFLLSKLHFVRWKYSSFSWTGMEEKAYESPQQREKHCYVFCQLSGQSPGSCRVISASLRNGVKRVRPDLSVLLFIYRLFHLPAHIMKEKWWEAPSLLRNVPLAKPCVYTLPGWDLPRITHSFFSALLPPLHSWNL